MLTDLKVKSFKKTGYYSDRDSLYLRVSTSGAKSWWHRIKTTYLMLGSYPDLSLSDARDLNLLVKIEIKKGNSVNFLKDCLHKTKDPEELQKLFLGISDMKVAKGAVTFEEAHQKWHQHMVDAKQWRDGKHVKQNLNEVKNIFYPYIQNKHLDKITQGDIVKALTKKVDGEQFWVARHETASRNLGRVRQIFDWYISSNNIDLVNPANINRKYTLPKPRNLKVKHHNFIEPQRCPEYFADFISSREMDRDVNIACLVVMMTAVRAGDVAAMQWDDVDLENKVWKFTVGKTDRLYRTPLTSEVVERIAPLRSNHKYVFDNDRSRLRHISPNVITMQFKKIPNYEVTAHGWRASLKTWATENSYRQEVTEMQLSHEKDKLEAAYNRTDYFAERAEMINNWQRYLMGE